MAELNQNAVNRPKRGLDELLSEDRTADLLFKYGIPYNHNHYNLPFYSVQSPNPPYSMYTGQHVPTHDPLAYIPGYEWWPQLVGPGTSAGYASQDYRTYNPSPLGSQLVPPQGLFTFNQNQLSGDFMHDVDPSTGAHIPQAGSSQASHAHPHPHAHGGTSNPNLPPGHENHEHRHYGHYGPPPP